MFYFAVLSFVIGIVLIIITNMFIFQSFKNKHPNKSDSFIHKQAKPKTSLVIKIGFTLILVSIVVKYISLKVNENTPEVESKDVTVKIVDEISQIRDLLGFSQHVILSPSETEILKKAIEVDLFKDKSFCEYYKEYKILELAGKLKESDNVIKSFKKIEGLELLFASKGHEFCAYELREIKNSNKGSNNFTFLNSENSCSISEDFIKMDLINPATADFSLFDCNLEKNSNGSYTILRKVAAQNSFGVEKEFIYKVNIGYIGGDELDKSSWKLISIKSEEYR